MATGPTLRRPSDQARDLQERFELFVDNVKDFAIFMTDSEGQIQTWTAGVARVLGYSESEFVGRSLSIIFVPEDIDSGAEARELDMATRTGRAEDERWHLRKDGSRFWASGVLTALRDDDGQLRGYAKVMRDSTDRKLAEEERKQLLQREQQARKEAETATRVRDQFLAMVSHELRFLPRVFEPFSQADMTIQREHGGLGLGLAIVRHLIHQHGGTIAAASGGVNQGATFTVELPLSTVRTEPAVGGNLNIDIKPALNGIRVVVVENDADSRELLVTTLHLAGASVRDAGTVADAFTLIGTEIPNVVVCDIGLPKEDGFAFIKRLRSLPPDAGGSVPAAALTAYTRPEDRLRALEAGYQIHLPKPIEPSDLVATVATLAGKVTAKPS